MVSMKGIRESLDKYAEMVEDSLEIAKGVQAQVPKLDDVENIIVAGMGGSAISGDILKNLSSKIPIEVSKSYILPEFADEGTLVFCISYSGNTEETLSQFVSAVKAKCKIISITSGGKLKEWSERLGIPIIELPSGYQPRAALPYIIFPMISCLKDLLDIRGTEEVVRIIEKTSKDGAEMNAEALKDRQIAIYAPANLGAVAYRFKTQLNENAKVLARVAVFPELDHNDIVGFGNPEMAKNLTIVLVRDKGESEEIRGRIEITTKLIKESAPGVKVIEVWSEGESLLARIMSLIYQTDLISARLARLYGIDPTPVEVITKLKDNLKSELNKVEKLEKEISEIK